MGGFINDKHDNYWSEKQSAHIWNHHGGLGGSVLEVMEEQTQGVFPLYKLYSVFPSETTIFSGLALEILQVEWVFAGCPDDNHVRSSFYE